MFRADSKERVPDPRLRGMNPKFVKMVWEKRRQGRKRLIEQETAKETAGDPEPIIYDIYAATEPSNRSSAKKIIEETAARHGLKPDTLKSNIRYREVVRVRQEAMARVYLERPDMSLSQIGRLFGGRDHTTVLHAIMKLGVHSSQTGQE